MQSHKSLSLLKFTACGHLSALNRVRYEVICKGASMKFHYTMLFNLKGKTFAETNLPLLLIMELGDGRLSRRCSYKGSHWFADLVLLCPPQLSSWVPSGTLHIMASFLSQKLQKLEDVQQPQMEPRS